MNDIKVQWHPGFVAAMNLGLKEYRDALIFEKEFNLNTKPLEIDLLIIKKDPSAHISNEIGGFFKGHNIWSTNYRKTIWILIHFIRHLHMHAFISHMVRHSMR